MARHDQATTVFSHTKYCAETIRNSHTSVGVCGTDTVVLAVETKSRSPEDREIWNLDCCRMAFAWAGNEADTFALFHKAKDECQNHNELTEEDVPANIEYITRYIAGIKHAYFGKHRKAYCATTLIAGLEPNSREPALYRTAPVGCFHACKADAIGRNAESVREFLDKNYKETSGKETIKLAIRALLEVDDSGGKNIEVAYMRRGECCGFLLHLEGEKIDALLAEIEAEKAGSPPKET